MENLAVTLYWRPRCPYCMRLRWQVRRARLRVREINIWKDPEGAARVREITGGDETVPTVTIGTTALVNPSIAELLAAVGDQGQLPARFSTRQYLVCRGSRHSGILWIFHPANQTSRTAALASPRFVPGLRRYRGASPERITSPATQNRATASLKDASPLKVLTFWGDRQHFKIT
jgi:glutaredoxin